MDVPGLARALYPEGLPQRAWLEHYAEFPGRHALEFRHPSWFCEDVYARLRSAGVALVIADDPEPPFATRELTAPFTYVRFHRGSRGRKGNYSDAENARRLDSGLTTAARPPPRGR